MLLHLDQVEQVAMRIELDEHVHVRIGPTGTTRTRTEDADPQHAHAAQRRQFCTDRGQQRVKIGVGVRTYGGMETRPSRDAEHRLAHVNGGVGERRQEVIAHQRRVVGQDLLADGLYGSGEATFTNFVPAPGAIALLGTAGLAGTRRRRD